MRIRTKKTTTWRQPRSGSLAVELLLVLPILVLLLAGMVQFSMVLTARQQLLAASREGARIGAQGGDATAVATAVKRSLGNGSIGDASVEVRVLPEDESKPGRGRDRVEVWVHVPEGHVAPNFLGWILNTDKDELVACTVMHRE